MKLLPIKLHEHRDGHNCQEDVIANLSRWLGRDYEMIFIDQWGFFYFPSSRIKIIGSRIDSGESRLWENLHYYHGIVSTCGYRESMEERFISIRRELHQNRPVVMHTDSFYIPWIRLYNKYHRDHTCLIVGIDDKDNIQCLDPFWNNEINLLPKENFILSNSICTTILLEEINQSINLEDELVKNIEKLFEGYRNKSSFEMIRDFGTEFKNLNLAEEVKGCKDWPYVAPLFMQLFKIGHNRTNFNTMLNYLSSEHGKDYLNTLKERLKLVKDKWLSIIHILAPMIEATDYKTELNYCVNTLFEIADEEEHIANNLYTKLKSNCRQ